MFFIREAHAVSQAECVARDFLGVLNNAVFYPLIIFLTALAFMMFLWGAFRFVVNAADSGARAQGRSHMMYGVIGLLIMVSAWAILTIAANTFGLGVPNTDPCGGAPYMEPGSVGPS